jgi:hypothetical protein
MWVRNMQNQSPKPFLWGPVKSALIQDAKEHGPDTILKLCHEDDQRVKEMMVAVLTEMGQDRRDTVEQVVRVLCPKEGEPNALQRIRALVRTSKPKPRASSDNSNEKRARVARKIAVEVAGNLGFDGLLSMAALSSDAATRSAAVRASYYLWQRDSEKVYSILNHLAGNLMHGLIPDVAAFETVIGLSLTIFFEHYQDETVRGRLQLVWRRIIDTIFIINPQSGRAGQAMRAAARNLIFNFAMSFISHVLEELPQYNPINYPDLQAFFHRRSDDEDRALLRRLVSYLDLDAAYSVLEWESDLRQAVSTRDLLVEMVFTLLINVRMARLPDETLPMIQRLFSQVRGDTEPTPYLGSLAHSLHTTVQHHPERDDIFRLFVDWLDECQQYYAKPEHTRFRGLQRAQKALQVTLTGPYVVDEYRRTGTARSAWLEGRIQRAIAENDVEFFEYLIKDELVQVALDARLPGAAFEVLALIVHWKGRPAVIDERIVHLLSRIRASYPEEVEDFLEELQLPTEMGLAVRTNEPVETVGSLIGLGPWDFIVDQAILGSTTLRMHLMSILGSAADFGDLKIWLEHVFREVLNLIYGKEVLPQSYKGEKAAPK